MKNFLEILYNKIYIINQNDFNFDEQHYNTDGFIFFFFISDARQGVALKRPCPYVDYLRTLRVKCYGVGLKEKESTLHSGCVAV